MIKVGRDLRRVTRKSQFGMGELTSYLTQVFQGIRHVKAYNAEQRTIKATETFVQAVSRLSQRMTRIKSYNTPFMEVLSGIAIAAVIFYGGSQVISGNRTTGEFTAFIFALISTYDPLKRIVNTWGSVQVGMTAAEGIFAMIDKQPTITDRPGAAVLDRVTGAIRLEDVHFSYGPAIPALRGISIDIPAGKTVALVGPSGAGKSTLLNLIPRFYDPTEGGGPDRGPRHPRGHPAFAARADRPGQPGDHAVRRHGARQHRLCPPGGEPGGDRGGGPRGGGARLHLGPAAGLRHPDRRARRCACPAASGSACRSPVRC